MNKLIAVAAAIVWDNVGGNDPEVMMTVSIWAAKAVHFVGMI